MSEKKRATPEDAKAVWYSLPLPTCELVRRNLIEKGFDTPGRRQIAKWKAKGQWETPPRPKLPRRHGMSLGSLAAAEKFAKKTEATGRAIIDSAAKELTGNPDATGEDLGRLLAGDIKAKLEDWRNAPSDEARMQMVVMEAMESAYILFFALKKIGPSAIKVHLIEPVGRCYQSISAGLVTATAPIEQIIAARSANTKTVPQPNGKEAEVFTAEEYDPVAESFKAAFLNGP